MRLAHLPYRPCVGVCVVNRDGLIFAGKRLDSDYDAWQMPQGGIDEGEPPLEAGYRELTEETGIARNDVAQLAVTADWISYDLPDELLGVIWGGRYRGQRQKWLCLRFLGDDGAINIVQDHQEFGEWAWMKADDLRQNIVPFKREIYDEVLGAFAPYLV